MQRLLRPAIGEVGCEAFPRGAASTQNRDDRRERIQQHEHHRRLTSRKGVAMLGHKSLDCKRRLPSDRFNELIGSGEYSVGMVDGDLPQVLHQELAARPARNPIAALFSLVVSMNVLITLFSPLWGKHLIELGTPRVLARAIVVSDFGAGAWDFNPKTGVVLSLLSNLPRLPARRTL